jgi:hypothetical protein
MRGGLMKKLTLVLMLVLIIAGPSTTPALADIVLGASLTDTTAEDGGFDADDNGWKIFFGYRPSRFFGVEGQYVDFGEFEDSVGGTDVRNEVTSLDVYAVGGFKIWRFDLFGKAGFASWDSEFTRGPGDDDSGTDFAWGIGAALRIGERFWVRAEREVYEVDDADLEMTSLGAEFRF